ncbi:uncharacterized protein LY79DRAFT_577781 [Colletotrichum navitas]|uniref:Uncharacterized protein n=1 Tax=Colletotrichum navitas TaxID=681940 RepID=A0AAD8Q4R6_9PEZI|nr:uncharacterized protein LY79DRAFT_577781 [Colletotrichum navitas]KAK1595830.1 hypothetical protein LY79DRAFT_577781 [Colletotrichum navitas]
MANPGFGATLTCFAPVRIAIYCEPGSNGGEARGACELGRECDHATVHHVCHATHPEGDARSSPEQQSSGRGGLSLQVRVQAILLQSRIRAGAKLAVLRSLATESAPVAKSKTYGSTKGSIVDGCLRLCDAPKACGRKRLETSWLLMRLVTKDFGAVEWEGKLRLAPERTGRTLF